MTALPRLAAATMKARALPVPAATEAIWGPAPVSAGAAPGALVPSAASVPAGATVDRAYVNLSSVEGGVPAAADAGAGLRGYLLALQAAWRNALATRPAYAAAHRRRFGLVASGGAAASATGALTSAGGDASTRPSARLFNALAPVEDVVFTPACIARVARLARVLVAPPREDPSLDAPRIAAVAASAGGHRLAMAALEAPRAQSTWAPRHVLLYGAPGCGKRTAVLLAAAAADADVFVMERAVDAAVAAAAAGATAHHHSHAPTPSASIAGGVAPGGANDDIYLRCHYDQLMRTLRRAVRSAGAGGTARGAGLLPSQLGVDTVLFVPRFQGLAGGRTAAVADAVAAVIGGCDVASLFSDAERGAIIADLAARVGADTGVPAAAPAAATAAAAVATALPTDEPAARDAGGAGGAPLTDDAAAAAAVAAALHARAGAGVSSEQAALLWTAFERCAGERLRVVLSVATPTLRGEGDASAPLPTALALSTDVGAVGGYPTAVADLLARWPLLRTRCVVQYCCPWGRDEVADIGAMAATELIDADTAAVIAMEIVASARAAVDATADGGAGPDGGVQLYPPPRRSALRKARRLITVTSLELGADETSGFGASEGPIDAGSDTSASPKMRTRRSLRGRKDEVAPQLTATTRTVAEAAGAVTLRGGAPSPSPLAALPQLPVGPARVVGDAYDASTPWAPGTANVRALLVAAVATAHVAVRRVVAGSGGSGGERAQLRALDRTLTMEHFSDALRVFPAVLARRGSELRATARALEATLSKIDEARASLIEMREDLANSHVRGARVCVRACGCVCIALARGRLSG